jgi:hypothetical protein
MTRELLDELKEMYELELDENEVDEWQTILYHSHPVFDPQGIAQLVNVHKYGIENVPAADTVLVANFGSSGSSWQTRRW